MLLIVKNKLVENASKILEDDLNIKLPEDYARFLDKYNGGATYETEVKIGKNWDDITGFNGVGDVNKHHGFNRLKSMGVLKDFLERKLLPIADNILGDSYCISLDEEYYGKIYIVYHDLFGKRKKYFQILLNL